VLNFIFLRYFIDNLKHILYILNVVYEATFSKDLLNKKLKTFVECFYNICIKVIL
jgi:hypothetical protein